MTSLNTIKKLAAHGALLITFGTLLVGCNPAPDHDSNAAAAPSADLHTAVTAGDIVAIEQHIAAGSDLNVTEPYGGSTPLMSAAVFGMTDIARQLIEAGADVDLTSNDGSTALHSAAFFCRPEIVDMLLAKGADKTIRNSYGSTAYESVAGPFEQVKPFYDAMGQSLAPMGLQLDYDYLQATRPQIAAVLK